MAAEHAGKHGNGESPFSQPANILIFCGLGQEHHKAAANDSGNRGSAAKSKLVFSIEKTAAAQVGKSTQHSACGNQGNHFGIAPGHQMVNFVHLVCKEESEDQPAQGTADHNPYAAGKRGRI